MRQSCLLILLAFVLASCTHVPEPVLAPEPFSHVLPSSTMNPRPIPSPATGAPVPAASTTPGEVSAETRTAPDPYALISQEHLFAFVEDLTGIQSHSGWRNSATKGEAQALDYVAATLGEMSHLKGSGLDLERQVFPVFLATELWEAGLFLTVEGQEVSVPADAPRGDRNAVETALWFDSDGMVNDSVRNPVTVEGPAVPVVAPGAVAILERSTVRDAVVLLNYAAVDPVIQGEARATQVAEQILSMRPAGIVLITEFSNQPGKSHGSFVGEGGVFRWVPAGEPGVRPPILYARLEDLAGAGIGAWEDLARVGRARLVWDADVSWPGVSGNLIARIPGQDPSRAVILSAHIDSPNSPGAMDDGSGSVVLLEVASVLDEARVQPPVDVYLAWFGSEEIGLFGSAHFAATHQELLDRTVGLLQIDMLSHPLDGIRAQLELMAWSHGRLGNATMPWPEHLSEIGTQRGIDASPVDKYSFYSDNAVVAGFDVPNANLIYMGAGMENPGPIHYGAHIHDPYDTVDLAREQGDVLEQMTCLALGAALDSDVSVPGLRVSPPPEQRAVFVGSHTEAPQMSPAAFTELGMALALAGFDVDMVPYGRPITEADLQGARLVVALPVLDYTDESAADHDEGWSDLEISVLEEYVAHAGLLVLTNSAYRLDLGGRPWDYNEDWPDANALAERFLVSYNGTLGAARAQVVSDHPLVTGLETLELSETNALAFTLGEGQVLAEAGSRPAVALIERGVASGQVLVLADLKLLGPGWTSGLKFWQNLATYARDR